MDLIATKRMKYATRMLQAGDRFTARSNRDGKLLVGIGRARLADEAEPEEKPAQKPVKRRKKRKNAAS